MDFDCHVTDAMPVGMRTFVCYGNWHVEACVGLLLTALTVETCAEVYVILLRLRVVMYGYCVGHAGPSTKCISCISQQHVCMTTFL